MATMAMKQYNVRLSESLIRRLDSTARTYGRDSGNKVAAEIVELYLDMWEEAERARQEVLKRQRSNTKKDPSLVIPVYNANEGTVSSSQKKNKNK